MSRPTIKVTFCVRNLEKKGKDNGVIIVGATKYTTVKCFFIFKVKEGLNPVPLDTPLRAPSYSIVS
jgi:hypothetical protein